MSSSSSDAPRAVPSIPAQLSATPEPKPQAPRFSFTAARVQAQAHVAKSIPSMAASPAVKPVTPEQRGSAFMVRAGMKPQPKPPARAQPIPPRIPSQTPAPASVAAPAARPSAFAPAAAVSMTATAASPSAAAPAFSFGRAAHDPAAALEAAVRAAGGTEISGMLVDLKMYNDWGRGQVNDERGRKINIKGSALAGLKIGSRYKFTGKMSNHEKYGLQLDVTQVVPDVESIDALIDHMSRNYVNVGHATAKKMAEFHRDAGSLEHLKQVLIHRPSILNFSQFTNKEVKLRDDEESKARRVKDSLAIRFGGLGIARTVISELGQWLIGESVKRMGNYGDEEKPDLVSTANKVLDENPYKPIAGVDRYGFNTADVIARKVGIKNDDPKRISAIVSHALGEGCSGAGHMWLTEDQLFGSILRLDRSLAPRESVQLAIEMGEPILIDEDFGTARYYTKSLRIAEQKLVDQLYTRLTQEVEPLCDLVGEELDELIERAIANIRLSKGDPKFTLDESQDAALRGIMTSRRSLHTLTAGPGCGKTAIVEVLMEALGLHRRLNTTFCAPIGKAAKVLTSRIKKWGVARTIHSTLEFTGVFGRDRENPLDAELVIADEQSMLGGPLGSHFFDAILPEAHVIMLGDPGQLSAIEPGQVLKSVLAIRGLDHHRLTKTHRNDGAILELVQMVDKGVWPSEMQWPALLAKGGVEYDGKLPAPTESSFAQLAHEVKLAAENFGGLDRVGVICPKRKGNSSTPDWNVTYLNHVLRDFLNPDPDGTLKITGSQFRMEDRIIVTNNMKLHQLEEGETRAPEQAPRGRRRSSVPVFDEFDNFIDEHDGPEDDDENKTYVANGDTGWLESVEYSYDETVRMPKSFVLRLDDDRRVVFPAGELEHLSLAYSITVHAAQGSEYGKTFCVVTPGHEQFMHRSMVFTELSRGKKKIKILGDQADITKIVARPAPHRNCAIGERVAAEVQAHKDAMALASLPKSRSRAAA